MRKINSLMLSFFLLLNPLSATSETTSNEIDIYLIKVFDYAKSHNLQALEELHDKIKQMRNRTLGNAYPLALYIASPDKYKQQFVESFPVNYEGIMYDLYEHVEIKQLTPKFLYSMEALGIIAEEGNIKAIEKVLHGVTSSDGVVSELFCDFVVRLLNKHPQKTIRCLSELKKEQRQKNYLCFKLIGSQKFASLKKKLKKLKTKASKPEIVVIQEIEGYQ